MKTLFAAATVASAIFAAAPASAVSFVTVNGSANVFAASAVGAQATFDKAADAGFSVIGGSTQAVAGKSANPFGAPDSNIYLYVLANGSATVSSVASAFRDISVYLGSIDAGNKVEVLGLGGSVLKSFTGSDLIAPASATGNQTAANTNRLVTFSAGNNEQLTGLRFTSNVNSLELDNVRFSAAVPEPATWAMMILGFGVVGYSLRRRPTMRLRQLI